MARREMVLKGTDNHPHPLTFCISGGNTQCSLCGNNIDEGSWFYFCSECSLRLHLRCGDQLEFPNKNRQEMETREMVSKRTCVRDNHQHPLKVSIDNFNHRCSLCCNDIDAGSWFYYCLSDDCSYCLHLYCGDYLEFVSLSSDLHPLKLLRLDNIPCHYCEKSYQNTLMYTCDECSVHIHQKCLVIPLPTISCDSEDHTQYMCHNHPMTLVKHDGKCDRVIRYCLACQSPWSSDLAYTCQKSCENVLHKACAELPQKIEQPLYHRHHSLKLQFCKPQSCSACYKRGGKLMYFCCDQGCNFILGTECAFLAPTMTWDRDDDHFLFLIERAYYGSDQNCYFCHNSYEKQLVKDHDEVIHTQSFLFRCFECDFNLHFLCGPFPSTIKHECHVHSLSLVDYIDNDDDSEDKDSDDCYCDACEKKRNPRRFRVYYCAKCKYVAHIHCVISEVIKVLQGDLTNVELLSVGDKRWKNTNEEEEKTVNKERWKNTNEEEEKTVNKEEAGSSIQTLKDLMESLTAAERKQLLNPYGDSSTGLKPLHDKAREENSRRYERKDDGEDIHRIQNLFNITLSDINDSYIHEFWYFISEEGLKFDERHLKMKVVDVEGYKVPRSLAPVLQTLLRQNGDFVRKSRLRPEMKSIACTFVCILFESMSMTKPEDITKDLLKHWVFYCHSIQTITGLDLDFLGNILVSLVKSFLGSEAIKFKKEMAERLPQQITKLQLQLETSKANLEKLKGIGESTASEFMKECLRQSSELKRKGCL